MAYSAGTNGVTKVASSDWQGLDLFTSASGAETVNGVSSAAYAGAYPSDGSAGYIPAVWSGKLIEAWYAASVIPAITSTDYEGEIKAYGDLVKIRTTPSITIGDYQIGQKLEYEVPGSDLVELAIDTAKFWAFQIDDIQKTQSNLNLMSIFAEAAAEQMKVAVDTAVLLKMVGDAAAANKGQTAGAISGNLDLGAGNADANIEVISEANAVEYILRLGQALDEQNSPETGRWLVIPAAFAAVLKDSVLRGANTMGDSQSVLRNGKIGMVDRFTIYVSNNLPTVTPSATTGTYVFAGVPSSCAFASQIVKNETVDNQFAFGELMRGLQVFGYQTVKPEGLVEGVVVVAHT